MSRGDSKAIAVHSCDHVPLDLCSGFSRGNVVLVIWFRLEYEYVNTGIE